MWESMSDDSGPLATVIARYSPAPGARSGMCDSLLLAVDLGDYDAAGGGDSGDDTGASMDETGIAAPAPGACSGMWASWSDDSASFV